MNNIDPSNIKSVDTVQNNIEIHDITLIANDLGFIICIINLIICLTNIKKIKQSKILLKMSIISMFISFIGKLVNSLVNSYIGYIDKEPSLLEVLTKASLCIIPFIIQIVILIKLIINIKNNRKEGGKT